MSSALAAAKRRRAFNNDNNNQTTDNSINTTTNQNNTQQTTQNSKPVSDKPRTINEALRFLNNRIDTIENSISNNQTNTPSMIDNEVIEEYENRFDLIIQEINNLKDAMLKLQSFTMDVNKQLFEERINILSSNDDISDADDLQKMIDNSNNIVEINDFDNNDVIESEKEITDS